MRSLFKDAELTVNVAAADSLQHVLWARIKGFLKFDQSDVNGQFFPDTDLLKLAWKAEAAENERPLICKINVFP